MWADIAASMPLNDMRILLDGLLLNLAEKNTWPDIAPSVPLNDMRILLNDVLLNLAEKEMTPSQFAQAQKLAQECIRKQYKDC